MTPNSLRSFAAGLLIAASLTGSVYFFGPSEADSSEKNAETVKTEKLTDEQMIEQLTSKGFVVHTEEEWTKQVTAASEKTEEKAEEKPKQNAEEQIVYRTVLTVSSGMTSIDVGNALEKAHIIEDGLQFFKEVENRGLENDLRPGTFDVESGMTMDEIISIVFK
jgi:glutamate synthase domain-containing protein 3